MPVLKQNFFDRFDFNLDAKINEIVYEDYVVKEAVAVGSMSPERLSLKRLSAQIGNSDIAASGNIDQVFDYLFDGGTLGGDLHLNSKVLDLNEFMVATEPPAPNCPKSSAS